MKKHLLLAFVVLVAVTANAQDFKTPVEYLNYIGKETDVISKTTWNYTKAVAHSKSARKIDATRKTLIKSIKMPLKKFQI